MKMIEIDAVIAKVKELHGRTETMSFEDIDDLRRWLDRLSTIPEAQPEPPEDATTELASEWAAMQAKINILEERLVQELHQRGRMLNGFRVKEDKADEMIAGLKKEGRELQAENARLREPTQEVRQLRERLERQILYSHKLEGKLGERAREKRELEQQISELELANGRLRASQSSDLDRRKLAALAVVSERHWQILCDGDMWGIKESGDDDYAVDVNEHDDMKVYPTWLAAVEAADRAVRKREAREATKETWPIVRKWEKSDGTCMYARQEGPESNYVIYLENGNQAKGSKCLSANWTPSTEAEFQAGWVVTDEQSIMAIERGDAAMVNRWLNQQGAK